MIWTISTVRLLSWQLHYPFLRRLVFAPAFIQQKHAKKGNSEKSRNRDFKNFSSLLQEMDRQYHITFAYLSILFVLRSTEADCNRKAQKCAYIEKICASKTSQNIEKNWWMIIFWKKVEEKENHWYLLCGMLRKGITLRFFQAMIRIFQDCNFM